MTALVLATGVTAHLWLALVCAAITAALKAKDGFAAGRLLGFLFPGIFGAAWFWAKIWGLS